MDPLWNNIFRKRHDEDSMAYFLNNLPMFSELNGRELSLLEKMIHQRSYHPGEVVFEEGDPGTGMYMIRSGGVGIFAKRPRSVREIFSARQPSPHRRHAVRRHAQRKKPN